MAKIESLTDAQIAQFPRYVREWTTIGTSTEPADRPRAEAAIGRMYAIAGLEVPRIVWCDSPLSMVLTKAALEKMPEGVGASVRASVRDSVRDSVGASVWASVWDSVRASVWASVWDSVRASVGDSVGASVRDSVGDSVGASVWASVFGQHEAGWLSFYRFFRDECGLVEQTEKLSGLWELAKSCGWVLPYKNICFASDRHATCKLDGNGRIHSEVGPAVAYRDGFAIYAWHGTRVPAGWIESKATVSPKDVLGHTDGNVRAAGIQIVGWARLLSELSASVVDRHPEGMAGGELLAVPKNRIEPGARGTLKLLRAACPRNGDIVFRVPDEIATAHAAQAWSRGLPPELFQLPAIRT